jgi:DNA-binding GntR family transcriptional regulator
MTDPGIADLTGSPRRAAETLLRRIKDQAPGTPIPSDLELAGQLHCAPGTAGKAKRALAADGHIAKDEEANRYRVI